MRDPIVVKIKKIMEEAIIPTYSKEGDACADLYTVSRARLIPGEICRMHTGLAFEIPYGWRIDVRPRSGMACVKQLLIPNSPGTIDAGYRGEMIVYLKNLSQDTIEINPYDRIAQIMIEPVYTMSFEEVDVLSTSERGGGGFGSTGS